MKKLPGQPPAGAIVPSVEPGVIGKCHQAGAAAPPDSFHLPARSTGGGWAGAGAVAGGGAGAGAAAVSGSTAEAARIGAGGKAARLHNNTADFVPSHGPMLDAHHVIHR